MYHYQALQGISLAQLAACFNLAFSDYEQPICFTPDSLEYYLTASNVDLSLSYGAFWEEEMVGFILNSAGVYQAQQVVFDAGTGVIPSTGAGKYFPLCLTTPASSCGSGVSPDTVWKFCNPITMRCPFTAKRASVFSAPILC